MSNDCHGRGRPAAWLTLLVVLAVSGLYAVLRYIVFGGVPVEHIPVFIVNKILAVSAAGGLLLAGLAGARGKACDLAFWARAAGTLATGHTLLSLAILNGSYFAKFFAEGKLNLIGELMILLGALCSLAMLPWLRAVGDRTARGIGVLVALLLAGHVLVMGYAGWLTPAKWHGGMPPISLVGFVLALAAAMLLAAGKSTAKPD